MKREHLLFTFTNQETELDSCIQFGAPFFVKSQREHAKFNFGQDPDQI